MTRFANKRVLVTGAFGGIGRAVAEAYGREGATVFCADIKDPAETVAAIRQSGAGNAIRALCDVSDDESVLQLFKDIERQADGLDILVHCAGIIHERALLETTSAEFDQVIAINLRGSFLVGREAIRMMENTGGRVILTASDLSYAGRETFSPYVASKHAVMGLVRSWAKEFAPHILVNALCPGPIDTAMLDQENMSEEWRRKEMDIPLQRFGRPEEIAKAALFLGGADSDFVTGQGLGINGGSVMP